MQGVYSYIKSDLFRYTGSCSLSIALKQYLTNPGFRFMVWHRIAHKSRSKGKFYYLIPWLILSKLKYKYGFDIPAEAKIGKGFYIGHFGGVVISAKANISSNCNISQGVTVGASSRGNKKGYPSIGDSVYIGPGAKVIGNITIGNNVAIGANAVVVDDVPDNAVVAGIPAKTVSMKGSAGYILNPIDI